MDKMTIAGIAFSVMALAIMAFPALVIWFTLGR